MGQTHISIVVPTYRCADSIEELYERLAKTLEPISPDFEIIFINDKNPENDWDLVLKLSSQDPRVKGINLSRNFGQHYAVTAGVHYSSGEWVVVMDGDLEVIPEDVTKIYDKAQEGYEIVYGDYRESTKPALIKFFGNLYHKVFNFLANNPGAKGNGRFVIMKRVVVDVYNRLRDRKRHFGPLLHNVGFKDCKLPLVPCEIKPQSSYSFLQKVNLAFTGIIAHSTILLKLGIFVGTLFSCLSFAFAIYVTARKILGMPVELGWSSIMASIYFLGGILLITVGIIGIYIETIILEVKGFPLYIVKDLVNLEPKEQEKGLAESSTLLRS